MKYVINTVAALLGLLFLFASLFYFFGKLPPDPNPPGSTAYNFDMALMTTGYMTFVKVCELIGGILVIIPKTRNFGLLFLGPIAINILCSAFFIKGVGSMNPAVAIVFLFPLFLLFTARGKFKQLAN